MGVQHKKEFFFYDLAVYGIDYVDMMGGNICAYKICARDKSCVFICYYSVNVMTGQRVVGERAMKWHFSTLDSRDH